MYIHHIRPLGLKVFYVMRHPTVPARTKELHLHASVSYNTDGNPEKQQSRYPTMSDTNRAMQSWKNTRCLKLQLWVEEELCYPWSENKGADHLWGNHIYITSRHF